MIIAAVGDIMPGGLLSGINEGYISQEILDILADADIRVGTLETAIGNEPTFYEEKMHRKADVIYSKDADLRKLKDLHIDIVSLANNHFFDLGLEGAIHAIALLDSLGIKHIGAGANLEEASRPVVVENNGETFAFIAFCDWREETVGWCPIATETKPGINPLYESNVFSSIKKCKQKYNHTIVLVHWGKEYESVPTIENYHLSYKMLHNGADLIIGSHTHSIQPVVTVRNKAIFYSLGNFLFPDRLLNSPRSTWYPNEDVEIKKLPITFEFPFHVSEPTLKVWRSIARKGLLVSINLDNSSLGVRVYETYLSNNQFLSICNKERRLEKMSFIIKAHLFPLYCWIRRFYSIARKIHIHISHISKKDNN